MSVTEALETLPERIRPRKATIILLWTIAVSLALLLAWAALAKIDRSISAQGRVIASSRLQIISNPEGGVLSEILVKDGDQVRAGQPLVKLDPTATSSELGSGEASAMALRIKIARLKAEVLGQAPVYPFAQDQRFAELIAIERSLHAARMAELAGLTGAANAQFEASAQMIGEANASLAAKRAGAQTVNTQLATTRELVDKRLEPRMTLEQIEGSSRIAAGEVAAAAAAAARARANAAEARASALQVRSEWKVRAANELAQAQSELAARERALPELKARVSRTNVRAPLAGRVNRVLVTTIGSAVTPGSPIVEIAPTRDTLIVEASVRPQDIARVRVGQAARINITAYDSAIYGGLRGSVETVSPDAIVNAESGESHYIVRVRTQGDALVDNAGRKLPIGAGMIADVRLLGEKRTILSYLLSPFTRLSQNAFRE